jgi:prepilin-type N-terminal cleavage/methylation domain-containing protein
MPIGLETTMTRQQQRRARGFSLIELLIVVVILGILAAIVIPAVNNSGMTARTSTLVSTVHTLRGQIAVYQLQHGDELPDLAAESADGDHFESLVEVTTHKGFDRGPYLIKVPVNPLTGNGSIVMNATTFGATGIPDPVPGADFIYDYQGGAGSGNIWGTTDRATGTPIIQ